MKLNFRRSTLSTEFIPEIDGLRFFAIITVVIFHLNTAYSKEIGLGSDLGISALGGRATFMQIGWWIVRMDLGVKVFFAISGFVLALPFLKQRLVPGSKTILLKEYFIRRLTRLEPPFIVSLLLFTFVHIFVLNANWSDLASHFWAGLLYAHVFIFGQFNPINPITWSLETEAQFYILVPVLFSAFFMIKQKGFKIIAVLIMFIFFVFLKSYILKEHLNHLSGSILSYMTNFMTGIIFAYLFITDSKQWLKKRSLFWDFAGIVSLMLIFAYYKPQASWSNNIIFNLGIFILLVSTFKGALFNRFFTNKIIYTIGGMCYSIYLLHFAFFHLLVKFTSNITIGLGYKTDLFLQFVVGIPLVLLVSAIFFLLIEKPCMNKKWPQQVLTLFRKGVKNNQP